MAAVCSRLEAEASNLVTRQVENRGGGEVGAYLASAANPLTGRTSVNVDPLPSSDLSSSLPCRSLASWFEMYRPRPVPPCRRVRPVSTCANGLKSRAWSADRQSTRLNSSHSQISHS